jgi:hypothetical protein
MTHNKVTGQNFSENGSNNFCAAYFADAGAIRERKNPSPCCINALFLYSSQSIQLAGFGFFF